MGWLERHALSVSLALILVATARIGLTYPVFSHTTDERLHIASGMEWLVEGRYTVEHQHPPLARVAAALGPYLAGEQATASDLLRARDLDHYGRVLALARLGELPFLWVAALVVHVWSRRYFGGAVAVMAVLLFTQLPAVLAHAGLATTDMALTALVAATVYNTLVWLERPTLRRTLAAGACLGLGVLSKFSSLVFVPAALLAMLGWYAASAWASPGVRWPPLFPLLARLPLALATACLVVWAGYLFSVGPVSLGAALPESVRLPAPELYSGIGEVIAHNRAGHPAYLLGERRRSGWWYFFPVALAVKTPLAFLLLATGGIAAAVRGRTPARWVLAYCAGVLAVAMPSRINIGVRHVLPIYVGLAILAASFAVDLLRRRRLAWTVPLLLAWLAASVALAHPDYLPYFNAVAGDTPERILVESDLDWGQDWKRAMARLHALGAHEVAMLPPGAEAEAARPLIERLVGLSLGHVDPLAPAPGWNAVGLTLLLSQRLGLFEERRDAMLWPETMAPTERVGKGILLYYVPPPGRPPAPLSGPPGAP